MRTRRRRFESFAGTVVVVTGAGSGIGRASARRFAELGARLHLADIDGDALARVREEIAAAGGTAQDHVVDSSDPAALEDLADGVFAADRAVDVLHNNAGVGHAAPTEHTTVEDWQRVIGVNLLGVAYGVQAFVPRMLRQGRGAAIVNTASGLGLIPAASMAPYTASKFGVVGMTEALNAELSPRGIRLSAICPGIIDTAITGTATMGGEMAATQDAAVAFYRRYGASPESVAESVVEAVRKGKLIQPVPTSHVLPGWLIHRLSARAFQPLSRGLVKLIARGGG
ncbi:MAG: SDR family NAD(P)-dependent oxidoreductase [Thermoleophilaceae bacterium]